ncbi:uncharacterized protein METZ01_LOCUS53636, partial [marine metagenome]
VGWNVVESFEVRIKRVLERCEKE